MLHAFTEEQLYLIITHKCMLTRIDREWSYIIMFLSFLIRNCTKTYKKCMYYALHVCIMPYMDSGAYAGFYKGELRQRGYSAGGGSPCVIYERGGGGGGGGGGGVPLRLAKYMSWRPLRFATCEPPELRSLPRCHSIYPLLQFTSLPCAHIKVSEPKVLPKGGFVRSNPP